MSEGKRPKKLPIGKALDAEAVAARRLGCASRRRRERSAGVGGIAQHEHCRSGRRKTIPHCVAERERKPSRWLERQAMLQGCVPGADELFAS